MAGTLRPTIWTKIDQHGRIVIPAEIRRELCIAAEEPLGLRIVDGELRIFTAKEGIRRAQELAANYTKGRTGIVDEFIADRHREAERE